MFGIFSLEWVIHLAHNFPLPIDFFSRILNVLLNFTEDDFELFEVGHRLILSSYDRASLCWPTPYMLECSCGQWPIRTLRILHTAEPSYGNVPLKGVPACGTCLEGRVERAT